MSETKTLNSRVDDKIFFHNEGLNIVASCQEKFPIDGKGNGLKNEVITPLVKIKQYILDSERWAIRHSTDKKCENIIFIDWEDGTKMPDELQKIMLTYRNNPNGRSYHGIIKVTDGDKDWCSQFALEYGIDGVMEIFSAAHGQNLMMFGNYDIKESDEKSYWHWYDSQREHKKIIKITKIQLGEIFTKQRDHDTSSNDNSLEPIDELKKSSRKWAVGGNRQEPLLRYLSSVKIKNPELSYDTLLVIAHEFADVHFITQYPESKMKTITTKSYRFACGIIEDEGLGVDDEKWKQSKKNLKIAIPFRYKEGIKDELIKTLPPTNEIGDLILREYRFAVIEDMEEKLFFEENHVFRINGKVILKKILQTSLEECWNTQSQNNIINYVMAKVPYKRAEFDQNRMILNCKNCFVDLENHEILDDDKIMSLSQITASYNPSLGRSKMFEDMLKECTPDYGMFLELVGCALTKQEINPEKILLLVGDGNNGKSVILKIIQGIFGVDSMSHKKLQNLQGNRFALAGIENKMLNIFADIPEEPLDDFDVLKSITTTGEYQDVEPKGVDGHSADIFATLLFSCNQLPQLPNLSKSIIKRLMVLPFKQNFKKDDNKIKPLLLEDEKSRILNTLIYYLDKVMVNGGNLTENQDQEKVIELWKNNSDGITLFINELIRPRDDDDSAASVSAVYTSYVKYCSIHKKTLEGNRKFNKIMERYGYTQQITRISGDSVRCWDGATLLKTAQDQSVKQDQSTID